MESSELASRAKTSIILSVVCMITMCIVLFSIVCVIKRDCSRYRQCELDTKKFTMETVCHIDEIISRPYQDIMSSSIFLKSSFLISFEMTSNGISTKQQFEESSVPVPFNPNVVSIGVQNTIDFFFLSP